MILNFISLLSPLVAFCTGLLVLGTKRKKINKWLYKAIVLSTTVSFAYFLLQVEYVFSLQSSVNRTLSETVWTLYEPLNQLSIVLFHVYALQKECKHKIFNSSLAALIGPVIISASHFVDYFRFNKF